MHSVPCPHPHSGLVLRVGTALAPGWRNYDPQLGTCLVQCSDRECANRMSGKGSSGSETGFPPILADTLFSEFDSHFGHINPTDVNLRQLTVSFWAFWYPLLQNKNLNKPSGD